MSICVIPSFQFQVVMIGMMALIEVVFFKLSWDQFKKKNTAYRSNPLLMNLTIQSKYNLIYSKMVAIIFILLYSG